MRDWIGFKEQQTQFPINRVVKIPRRDHIV